MAKRSFYQEMAQNRRDSLLLAVVVSIVLFGLIYSMAYIFDPEALIFVIPFSLILIFVYTWGSYQYGDRVVLSSTGARPADGREYQYLRDTVEGLAIAAGVPAPKIYVIDSDEMNAFATGKDPEHASIAVTTGLMRSLNRQELEGVVAHEMSHVRNKDVQFMTYVAVLVGLIAIISHLILRSMFWGVPRSRKSRDRGGGGFEVIILVVGLILAIIAPIVTKLVQFAVSRRREFLADASGAELTRYPEGLASALEKIGRLNKGKMNVSEAVSHIFFADPNKTALDSLYSTHPPIEERVKRLREM